MSTQPLPSSLLPSALDLPTFHRIIDAMYDEVLIYDGNYTIVYINQACCRHYGCKPEQMMGKSFFDFVSQDWWGPSILPIVYNEKKSLAIRQKTYIGSELLTIAVPLFDAQGNIEFVVMNVRDLVNDRDLYNPQYLAGEHALSSRFEAVSESADMRDVLALLQKVAQVDVTCILSGESGTGKTMLAKYMHSISPRRNAPFLSINCAGIPNELLESELFGYVKGAFTGASQSGKKGLLEEADSGTLLLDEVSELSPSAQAKLLQVLQEQEFIPLGGSKPVRVNVRIIAATNKNLPSMVKNQHFREDLFYRLNVVEVHIPPLRQRRKDIPALIQLFLQEFSVKYGVSRQLSENALDLLCHFDWPGNVRELRHMIERLVVTIDSLIIDVPQLPKNLFGISDLQYPIFDPSDQGFAEKMDAVEAQIIRSALQKYSTSRSLAAALGLSQTKAAKLIRKHRGAAVAPKNSPEG